MTFNLATTSRQSETEQAQAEQRQRSGFGDYGGSDRERTNKRAATAAKQTTGGETPAPDEAITNPLGKELQRRGCNAWFNRDGSGIPVKRIYKEALGYVFQPEDWRDVAVRDAINHDIEAGHQPPVVRGLEGSEPVRAGVSDSILHREMLYIPALAVIGPTSDNKTNQLNILFIVIPCTCPGAYVLNEALQVSGHGACFTLHQRLSRTRPHSDPPLCKAHRHPQSPYWCR